MVPLVDGFVLRPIGPADEAAVVEMSLALYADDPGGRDVGAGDVRRTIAHFLAVPERGRIVVLEGAGAVVGYAILVTFWSNESGGVMCVVDELYLRPAWRGQGLGSAFFRALRRVPPYDEAVAIDLEVTPRNAAARALYERLGFRPRANQSLRLLLSR